VKKIAITPKVDFKQFENEARHLSTLTHQNIVNLEGYCYEEEMGVVQHEGRGIKAAELYILLCFEYMPKGSLDKHLSGMTVICNIAFNLWILFLFVSRNQA
jgi:disease resistance protein RPM1